MALCFVPVSAAQLSAWAGAGVLTGETAAFAVTAEMTAAFGLDDPAGEEAEYTALAIASIAALLRHGRRLIAVADTEPALAVGEADFGTVLVSDVPWTRLTALFADEPEVPVVAAAARAVPGLSLAEAWDHPAVTTMLSQGDLLWYGPGEWSSLVRG